MAEPFVDTNIFLRHLLADDPEQSPRAAAYLARIERGEARGRTADTAIFEVVFTLQRTHHRTREEIREALTALITLPGILITNKRRLLRAFDLYVEHHLSFGDAYHAALMEQEGLTEIITFDRGFERLPGVRRSEP